MDGDKKPPRLAREAFWSAKPKFFLLRFLSLLRFQFFGCGLPRCALAAKALGSSKPTPANLTPFDLIALNLT
jgi:hypothetical protein